MLLPKVTLFIFLLNSITTTRCPDYDEVKMPLLLDASGKFLEYFMSFKQKSDNPAIYDMRMFCMDLYKRLRCGNFVSNLYESSSPRYAVESLSHKKVLGIKICTNSLDLSDIVIDQFIQRGRLINTRAEQIEQKRLQHNAGMNSDLEFNINSILSEDYDIAHFDPLIENIFIARVGPIMVVNTEEGKFAVKIVKNNTLNRLIAKNIHLNSDGDSTDEDPEDSQGYRPTMTNFDFNHKSFSQHATNIALNRQSSVSKDDLYRTTKFHQLMDDSEDDADVSLGVGGNLTSDNLNRTKELTNGRSRGSSLSDQGEPYAENDSINSDSDESDVFDDEDEYEEGIKDVMLEYKKARKVETNARVRDLFVRLCDNTDDKYPLGVIVTHYEGDAMFNYNQKLITGKSEPLSEEQRAQLYRRLLDIVEGLKIAGYTYCNFTPENISFNPEDIESTKLINFEVLERSVNPCKIGTPQFAPPELVVYRTLYNDFLKLRREFTDFSDDESKITFTNKILNTLKIKLNDFEENVTDAAYPQEVEYYNEFITSTESEISNWNELLASVSDSKDNFESSADHVAYWTKQFDSFFISHGLSYMFIEENPYLMKVATTPSTE